jgi:hypothetical protein
MKIAILFSGRIFRFGNHYNNIMENIVQGHDADFFLSHSPELDEDLESFCEMYKPVATSNDPIPEFDFTQYPVFPEFTTNRRNIISMLYNRVRVFNLLETHMKINNIEYDFIVSYRLDLFSYNKLDYKIEPNILYIPEGSDHCGGINDQVAYGTYEPMKIYMHTFNNIYNILDSGCPIHPELINKENLLLHNINIQRVPFDYEIIRGGHSTYINAR